jgi:uncharacterized protein
MREIALEDLRDLARGAAVLGTGGGGDPTIGRLLVEQALLDGGRIVLVDADELEPDAFVVPTAMMGAPSVMIEKLPAGDEGVAALRALEAHLGRKVDATMPIECGGINSMIPLAVAARTGLPVVDADGMGRAFPELQMETFGVYGIAGTPMAIADERGNTSIISTRDNERMEWYARGLTIRIGGAAHTASYPMTAADVVRTAVPRTITLGILIGRTIREARERHEDPFEALANALTETLYERGSVIFEGKVIDVERRTEGGFTKGRARVAPFEPGDHLDLTFQNEQLMATVGGQVRAIVPDLICVLDAETAEPITTEHLRYAQRVRVFAISTPAMMRTPEALRVFGPAAFGLDHDWEPVESLLAG